MTQRNFKLTVQGRLADHLGKHLYKQRPAALAELISNSWDACATQCLLSIPVEGYDPITSEIVIVDDGIGMSADDVQEKFLVLSRNRREEEGTAVAEHVMKSGKKIVRQVMGRKGIGKLAGFGIAQTVEIVTWQGELATRFVLDGKSLRTDPKRPDEIVIPGEVEIEKPDLPFHAGTQITLRKLKQATAIGIQGLMQSLARRFSRKVIGEMVISINGESLGNPPEWENLSKRFPEEGFESIEIGGQSVRYWYGYHNGVIKPAEAQGVTVLANGKIAQQTPFFFGADSGTGQFAGRYITGAFEADYLDAGLTDDEDESDIISTDRQEIDWEHERARPLHAVGNAIMRKAFSEWNKKREDKTLSMLESDAELKSRFEDLVPEEQEKVREVAKAISHAEKEHHRERQLLDTLLRAYEFRAFHDVIEHLDSHTGGEQLAAMLEYLTDWKVVESRALLEIVSTRLQIVDRFHKLIVEGAPEKAVQIGGENIHDLLARHPWLLNPRFQVIAEEKAVRTHLRDMEYAASEVSKGRIDFLAHREDGMLTVIEIKRPGLAVTLEEMQRLTGYLEDLRSAHEEVTGVFVATNFQPTQKTVDGFLGHFEIVKWAELFSESRKFLEHFRAILTADVHDPSFKYRKKELQDGKRTLKDGTYIDKTTPRSSKGRLGVQDADGLKEDDAE